jgi:hypothetical protein
LHEIFGIEMAYQGTLVSQFAKLKLDSVVDDLNDDTLDVWADLQSDAKTDTNCPLSPFMEKETLKDSELNVDGSLFVKTVGFE